MRMANCLFCGTVFMAEHPNQVYCSDRCRILFNREKDRERSIKRKAIEKANRTANMKAIEDINRLAFPELSYGKYVAKYNL